MQEHFSCKCGICQSRECVRMCVRVGVQWGRGKAYFIWICQWVGKSFIAGSRHMLYNSTCLLFPANRERERKCERESQRGLWPASGLTSDTLMLCSCSRIRSISTFNDNFEHDNIWHNLALSTTCWPP